MSLTKCETFNTIFQERYSAGLYLFSLAVFVIGGFIYSYYLGAQLKFRDERLYLAIAENIASGNGFSFDGLKPTAFLPPVYPFLLALFIKMGASVVWLRYMNFVFLGFCLFTMRSILQYEKAGKGIGLAAILMLGYCVLFYTAGTLYPQTLFALILLIVVRVAVQQPFRAIDAFLLGILSAVIVLVHGTGIFVPPVICVWLVVTSNKKRQILKRLSLAVFVSICCLSAWAYRNYTVFHRFIPLTTHGGDILYIGNNPHTSLSAWYEYVNEDFYKEASKLPEEEQNSYYVRRTIEFWTSQPWHALRLYFLKLTDYFNFRNNLCVSGEFNTWRAVVMFITYYPLLFSLIARILSVKRFPFSRFDWLLSSLYIGSAFFHAVFLPRIRFRLPYDMLLTMYIGYMYSAIIRGRMFIAAGEDDNGT